MTQKVLVVGIGNQIRQDDALGPYCVQLLQGMAPEPKNKLVDYHVVHQLDVVDCDLFARYDLIIFIDADSQEGPEPYVIKKMLPEAKPQPFTSHIGSIPDLICLTGSLYGVTPAAYLIAVRGSSFEVGEELSPVAANNASEAVLAIKKLIDEFFPLS